MKRALTIDDNLLDTQFSLSEEADNSRRGAAVDGSRGDGRSAEAGREGDAGRDGAAEAPVHVEAPIRPVPLKAWFAQEPHREKSGEGGDDRDHINPVLTRSRARIEEIFHLPKNKDVIVRDFTIGTPRGWPAFAVFVDGMSQTLLINTHILEPLMLLSEGVSHSRGGDDAGPGSVDRLKTVQMTLLPGNQLSVESSWEKVVPAILSGSTAVFVDGCDAALIVETKGWEHRSVSPPLTEAVVRGPHDAFTENFRANTALVRTRLRSEHLVTEMMSVGRLGRTDVALMYIEGLTNERLVAEVKRRIEGIDVDYLPDSGLLEQFIEDNPWMSVPQVDSTERPDRVAHMLSEGHVAIFVGNSPFVLVAPVVFWTMVHSPEDAYLRVPFGTFLRMIRWISLFIAILLPGMYIAVTNYHPEMLPTGMLLAIAAAREQVPFPVLLEVLLMEFAIELIREAGIRIPSAIGPTIGIVGALIIGQAAVQAGIVSPLLVIIVAVTALASFTIPNYNLGFGVRILRFAFLFAAAFCGFYGIALLLCAVLTRLAVQKSFGVPLLAPVVPSMDTSPDVLVRGPAYTMNQRPTYLFTRKSWRQQPVTRPWSPNTRQQSAASRKEKR
ncbi:spore germination protein [Alicyclobacillus cycloheptanicus]|nr:spore germination protein [Alicyclobacillus cycloheptanicus]